MVSNYRKFFILSFALFVMQLLVLNQTCYAQATYQSLRASSPEDVIIAFYRFSGKTPDFTLWAELSEDYINAHSVNKQRFLEMERRRLIKKYKEYTPDRDLINIYFNAEIKATPILKDTNDTDRKYLLEITLSEHDADYFPFVYNDLWVAVIPDGLESKKKHVISADMYDRLGRRIGLSVERAVNAVVVMSIIPKSVDSDNPMLLDGQYQWLMMSDIAYIFIQNNEGQVIWSNKADWFTSHTEQEIINLYRK